VAVPHWVHGAGRACIVAPVEGRMALLALGGSVGTAGGRYAAPLAPSRMP
jgi:hypothetical protein